MGDAIEDGGCECRGSVWKPVRVTTPIDRTKMPKAKAAKKHVWTQVPFPEITIRTTKRQILDHLELATLKLNDLGTENAKLKNQIASLKKKGAK